MAMLIGTATTPVTWNLPMSLERYEHTVGATPAIEIGGRASDLRRMLKAVEAAADGVR